MRALNLSGTSAQQLVARFPQFPPGGLGVGHHLGISLWQQDIVERCAMPAILQGAVDQLPAKFIESGLGPPTGSQDIGAATNKPIPPSLPDPAVEMR